MLSMLRLAAALTAVASLLGAGSAAADRDRPWSWPLRPRPDVVRPFVAPLGPFGPGHRGADLAGAVGEQVHPVDPGRVTFAGSVAGRGVVVVDHGRLRTTYEPVLVSVHRGERVQPDDVLGTLTLVGGHCLPLPCLHLGARIGDRYVDPMRWLGSGLIRLLPLSGSAESDVSVPTRGTNRTLASLSALAVPPWA